MEVPGAELCLDLGTLSARGRQVRCKTLRAAPCLLDLGKALLDLPSSVALLERLGETALVTEGERWDVDPDGEAVPAVRPGELEGAQSADGASERRVPSEAIAEPERAGRLGEVEVEPVSVHLEPVGEPAQQPGGRGADHAKVASRPR